MRVLVWGINYAPEVTGIAPYNQQLCEYLTAQGYDVEMVAAFAYYPAWQKSRHDAGTLYRRESVNGVRVHRCWHFVPRRVSAWKRMLHEASFVFTSFFRVLTLRPADLIVVISPPLLLGTAAAIIGWLRHAPFVFHVQDLQPDAALGLGMLRAGWLTRTLYGLESFAYHQAARVSGISRGMIEAIASKGVPKEKLVYFPNTIESLDPAGVPAGAFRRSHGIDKNAFLAVYSGNLGVKQGLRVLLDAAALLTDPRMVIVICGDGAERQTLAAAIATRQLRNVRLLPLQPRKEYHEMLTDADVCLITQQAGSGRAFFPSKLLATLNFAKPVVTVADLDSELVRALREGNFGVNVAPNQPAELARQLEELAARPAQLARMAVQGREYAAQFEAPAVFRRFERMIAELVRQVPAGLDGGLPDRSPNVVAEETASGRAAAHERKPPL